MADPTPAPGGTRQRSTPSFSQSGRRVAGQHRQRRSWCTRTDLRRFRPHEPARHWPCFHRPLRPDQRRRRGIHVKRSPTCACSAAASVRMQLDRPAGEIVGVQFAQHQVGVGHGGRFATTTVTRGPGSEPALSGPTRIWRIASTWASDPPPAPISTMSITGIEIGMPEPFLNR